MEIISEKKPIQSLNEIERDQIFKLTAPYYIDPTELVKRELKHNNVIYLIKDNDENILAFFMVAWEKHIIKSSEIYCVYLGLSCAQFESKETGLASRVYIHFTMDAFEYELQTKRKLLLYGTTATPVVLLTIPKIWENVRPDLVGNATLADFAFAKDFNKSIGLDRYTNDHPFILKKIAFNTKYSPNESFRLKEIENNNKIALFEKLNIDESSGNRLLILCAVPDKIRIDYLKAKMFELNQHKKSK